MKLISKTQRIYLILVIVLLMAGSGLFMYAISSVMKENVDEALHSNLLTLIHQSQKSGTITPISTPQIKITPITAIRDTAIQFSDTTMYNDVEHEPFKYRQISTEATVGGQPYHIIMRRAKTESDDLFMTILMVELIFAVLLVVCLFILNRNILQKIWNPFYDTLRQITNYEIGQQKEIVWSETEIDEFQELNSVLENMIAYVEKEYNSLKEFTENASHEIQTPLSVISSKVDQLLQDESLDREKSEQLYAIKKTAGKLSRLNKALLQLTKIENNQYVQKENINISELLQKLIDDYCTLAQAKNIELNANIQPDINLNINSELAELMLRNLLSNAVKHSYSGGFIDITLTDDHLMIRNTGKELKDNPEQNFKRFRKASGNNDSLGLGLSIVSAIVNINGYNITYNVEKNIHQVVVSFD